MNIQYVHLFDLLDTGTQRVDEIGKNSSKMHAPRWTCTAPHNIHGKTLLIQDHGLVCYRPWDMQSIFSERVCLKEWGV
jgi:hypothetical protein